MKRCIAFLTAWSAIGSLAMAAGMREINPPADPPVVQTIALTHGRLIDGRGGHPIEDAIVVIRGTKILAAGQQESIQIPEDARRVDVRGFSLLPGLIDSHFHSQNNVRTPVEYELNNGITTFRDPGHPFRFYDEVRQSTDPMPRVFLCGGHLDAHPPVWPDQAVVIRDAQHARQAVDQHVDQGASAIKIYFRLPLEHIRAACDAARERGVIVTAHLELVDADDAIEAGVRGIEHVTSFGTVLAEADEAERFKSAIFADSAARRELRHRLWANIDLESPRVRPLLDTIVKNQVVVSPTLAVFEAQADKMGSTEAQVRGFANMVRFIGMCHQAGARIVVGSHTQAPFAEKGRAYLREMELLVAAGLTPLEAIRAGTQRNAEFLGIEDRLGTLEAGQLADVILVPGDPSRDLGALRHVKHVMLNGNWIGPAP